MPGFLRPPASAKSCHPIGGTLEELKSTRSDQSANDLFYHFCRRFFCRDTWQRIALSDVKTRGAMQEEITQVVRWSGAQPKNACNVRKQNVQRSAYAVAFELDLEYSHWPKGDARATGRPCEGLLRSTRFARCRSRVWRSPSLSSARQPTNEKSQAESCLPSPEIADDCTRSSKRDGFANFILPAVFKTIPTTRRLCLED